MMFATVSQFILKNYLITIILKNLKFLSIILISFILLKFIHLTINKTFLFSYYILLLLEYLIMLY